MLTANLSQKILGTNIDHIEISITGIKQEIYSLFQGYNNHDTMELVINNIRVLLNIRSRLKKKTIISLSYIYSENSKEHLNEFVEYWRKTGVDRIYVHPLIFNVSKQDNSYKSCYMIGKSLFLHSNGDVKMCCYDFKRELIVGNCFQNSIKEIIEGELFTKMELWNNSMEFFKMSSSCHACINLKKFNICLTLKHRRRIIYYSWRSKVKGFIWEVGILLYENVPPNRHLYKILYYLKAKLNVF